MKRIFASLLCLLLLAGCGAGAEEAAAPETRSAAEPETAKPGLVLEMEHSCYDASLDSYTYFVRNNTEEAVLFGEDYSLQRQTGGSWKRVILGVPDTFTAIGYELQPGGTLALTCSYNTALKSQGTYRLVKEVGGETLYAEFEIGDSPYTAETPYGFVPLEDLPDDYSAGTAADTDVVFTGDGPRNLEAAEAFLEKAELGVPCQLRTVQDYGEGAAMAIDVIYENDHFLWRMRQNGEVAERRFSYIVTDGTDIYLSNGADWENSVSRGGDQAFLLPEGTASQLVPAVEDMTAERLEGNSARYRVWSADGAWSAMLTDAPTEFGVSWQKAGEGAGGSMCDLQDWDGLETAILGLAWQEDGRLRLDCETAAGGTDILYFDPETERLTDR